MNTYNDKNCKTIAYNDNDYYIIRLVDVIVIVYYEHNCITKTSSNNGSWLEMS